MVQKGVPYIPVNKRANNPVDSFTPALDFFFFSLAEKKKTWGREIQVGNPRPSLLWIAFLSQRKKMFELVLSCASWRHVQLAASAAVSCSFSLMCTLRWLNVDARPELFDTGETNKGWAPASRVSFYLYAATASVVFIYLFILCKKKNPVSKFVAFMKRLHVFSCGLRKINQASSFWKEKLWWNY